MKKKIEGKEYETVIGGMVCRGCAGYNDYALCASFGPDCILPEGKGKIWKAIDEGNEKV